MKSGKKIVSLALSAVVTVSASLSVFAIPATNPENNSNASAYNNWNTTVWSTAKNNYANLSMTPGATASQMNFSWYATSAPAGAVRIATDSAMTQNVKVFDEKGSLDINVTNKDGSATYTKAVRVTVSGLKENTVYYYQYTNDKADDSAWSEATTLKTGSTSNFKALFVGDPQIGSSGNAAHDAFNWDITLSKALQQNPDLDFILSAGDQVEHQAENSNENRDAEVQYAGYLGASVLKNLPVATAIGNHESNGLFYKNHFNNPNTMTEGSTTAGGDYYFSYGKVLFIVLNSNNTNGSEHDAAMKAAVESNPEAAWRIVMFHHDIYGAGAPHSNSDGAAKRNYLAPLMDKYNVDVCLTGHDHAYSRTYQILDGKAIDYDTPAGGTVTDPQGTLYMTANSATGSKYYDLVSTQQYYVADMSQKQVPTYSTIEMTDNSFQIKTYQVNDDGTVADTGDGVKIVKNVTKASLYNMIQEGQAKADEVTAENATPATWAALKAALSAANTLLETDRDGTYENGNMSGIVDKTKDNTLSLVTKDDLDSTYLALVNAINGLKIKGDSTELNAAITSAQTLADNASIGSNPGQYPEAAKTALLKAISEARTVAESVESSQADMDNAESALEAAVKVFKQSVIKPSNDKEMESDTPKTGDGFQTVAIAVICLVLLGGAGTIVLVRRKSADK